MTFRQLIVFLADRIGHHQIPVRDDAHDIGDLLGADAVHHDLIHDIVKRLYKANRCGYLDADIDADTTFSILGEARGEIRRSPKTDIDQVLLIDRLGTEVATWFRREQEATAGPSRDTSDSRPESATALPPLETHRPTVTSLGTLRK